MDKVSFERTMVTGANGFIGRAILNEIRKIEGDAIGLTRLTISSETKKLQSKNDIALPSDKWASAITSMRPKTLILCDWEGVGGKDREEKNVQQKNIDRWFGLFDAAKSAGTKRIIALGSQAEIDKNQNGIKSDAEFAPTTVYGEAKAELYKKLWKLSESSGIKFDWIRIFSVYGENAENVWLIPKVIAALKKSEEISLTKCEQEWNFLHVNDVACAVLKILAQTPSNGVINVANPVTNKLQEVLDFIGQRMNKKELLKYGELPYSENQVMVMRPDLTEILSTGWSPKEDLYRFLERAI